MNITARTLTLFIFTLLQCVAPLVHAHIDGKQSENSIFAQGNILPSSIIDASHCYAEPDETPAITLPHEYPRQDAPIVLSAPVRSAFNVAKSPGTYGPNHYQANIPPAAFYSFLPAQAPPML